MTLENLTTLLYIWLSISLVFPFIIALIIHKYKKLQILQKKSDIATRHYEEMLYATKDGYLTYSIYKNKNYEYTSRRLATLLNLKEGEKSTIKDVLDAFSTPYKEKLTQNIDSLIKRGIYFEEIAKTHHNKTFVISGSRINSADSEINSNCIWFKDITEYTNFIDQKTLTISTYRQELEEYRILIDNLPTPVCLRDDKLNIKALNRPYLNLLGLKNFKELTKDNSILHDLGNSTDLKQLIETAKSTNTPQKKQINILNLSELKKYEITETPYHNKSLKNTHIIGSLVDITPFDEAKRNYQMHLDSHLEILSTLDTAFCIINTKHEFIFSNSAFLKLWGLPQNFIDSPTHYNNFLDKIREQQTLPEVPDFKLYKEEELKAFDSLTEPKEDLLYIPDGRTFKRIRAPHSNCILIAYEDITDTLAIERNFNDMLAVQQGILNNLTDSVVIFSPNLKLKLYNTSFASLLGLDTEEQLSTSLKLQDIIELQKTILPEVEDWQSFKNNMINHITSITTFKLKLKDNTNLTVTPSVLPDTSLMITYHKK